jgi:hypothetical protein
MHGIILCCGKGSAEVCNLSYAGKPSISSFVFYPVNCFGFSLYGTIITVVWSGHTKPQGLTHVTDLEIQSGVIKKLNAGGISSYRFDSVLFLDCKGKNNYSTIHRAPIV